ncbi:hypothetical protein [Microbacterium hominis]|uniref:Uncharacterized protein n=1 Tax=Microbacterium hominis TaxID=162426 RepID=A0A2K9DCY4_9MICO|nr:hypothetical protein [Microbacterium hominis]AUG28719.1 hypothetical protein CXR34_04035 [Microbacterium hominis]
MTTTIAALASEYDMQPYAVAAALDLPGDMIADDSEIDSFAGWTEAEAREALDLLAQQAADRA